MKNYLIDTHTHIDMLQTAAEDVVLRANSAGVEKMIVPAANEEAFEKILTLAETFENVYGAFGIHPEDAELWHDGILAKIRLLKTDKIVAIGEIGLDYHYDKTNAEKQKQMFIELIKLANELSLPIIVHDRDAHKDCLDILDEYNHGSDVVMHCFSGSVEFMRECVKRGYYIGIGGVVTFKNAQKLKDVAIAVPIEKLVVETDAPFLAPTPHRGEENEPAYVRLVAEEISRLRQTTYAEIADATSTNAERIFKI